MQQQLTLLAREIRTSSNHEVVSIATSLALMTDDDPNVETWFVAANAEDAAAWARLLRPVMERALAG